MNIVVAFLVVAALAAVIVLVRVMHKDSSVRLRAFGVELDARRGSTPEPPAVGALHQLDPGEAGEVNARG